MKNTTVCSKRSVEKKNPCALIVGASSGIGREVALLLLEKGWRVGVCCRRLERLHELADRYPGQVETEALDVCQAEAPQVLERLMERVGRIDVFYLISGVGWQNPQLDPAIELQTVATNAAGFTRMVTAAFRYFESVGGGQLRWSVPLPEHGAWARLRPIRLPSASRIPILRRCNSRHACAVCLSVLPMCDRALCVLTCWGRGIIPARCRPARWHAVLSGP